MTDVTVTTSGGVMAVASNVMFDPSGGVTTLTIPVTDDNVNMHFLPISCSLENISPGV